MVHISLNIKACCLYVIWEKQDEIWAKFFCIPKNMHSRTLMAGTLWLASQMWFFWWRHLARLIFSWHDCYEWNFFCNFPTKSSATP